MTEKHQTCGLTTREQGMGVMNYVACSLCGQIMSEDNAMAFGVEIPQIGKRLTFSACVACQEKAKTHTLYVCLGCKSVSWFPSGDFVSGGVKYHVKFQCNRCMTRAISETLVP